MARDIAETKIQKSGGEIQKLWIRCRKCLRERGELQNSVKMEQLDLIEYKSVECKVMEKMAVTEMKKMYQGRLLIKKYKPHKDIKWKWTAFDKYS